MWNLTWMAIGNEVGLHACKMWRSAQASAIAVVFCCELRDLAPKNMLLIKYMLFLAATSPQDCGKPFYLNNYLAFFGAIRAKYPHMVRGPARLLLMCVVNSNSFAYLNSRCDFCLEPSAPSTRTW